MAINKNFVVKNGIEVNTNLIVADTDSNKVGIGTTVPEYTLHVFEGAGIGVTNITVTGISTNLDELNVGVGGTTLTAISNATLGIGGSVGVGTDAPGYLLEVHSPVSSGQTALFVRGDMRVTGDINIDDISIGDLNVSGISTFVGNILIGTGATVGFGSTAFFKDHAKAIFGDGEDLKIYHDGSSSYVDNSTGGVYVRNLSNDQDIFLQSDDGSGGVANYILCNGSNGQVELFHYGSARFKTNAIGVEATGTFESTGITTLASDAGITTTGGDLYVGGDLYINEDIVLDTNLEILGIATVGSIHVTGISTLGGTVNGPNLTNSVVVGTGLSVHGSTTGVAVTLAGAGGITTTGGDLYVGGDLFITEDITLDTNLSILGIATIGTLNLSSTSGINTIDSTVQSTSKDTGSLVLEGGLGVEKSVFIGDGLDVTGIATVHGGSIDIANAVRHIGDPDTHVSFPTADEVQIQTGGTPRLTIGSGGISTFSGVIDSNDTTQSTSATTGSAQFAGGVGIEKQLYVGAGASVGAGFTIGTGIGVTTILDDDLFNNASAGALASQQSIKAYVDAQITAEDLDFAGDTGTGAVDLDSQTLTISGTTNEIETSASNQTLTIGLPNDVTIGQDLTVTRNVSIADSIFHTGDTDTALRFPAADTITATTAGAERLRVNSNGKILSGIATARGNLANNASGVEAQVQIEGTSFTSSTLSIIRNSDDANDGGIILGKTRSATTYGNAAVQAGDDLGDLIFAGSDGTSLQFGAEILAEVQSGVGNDDLPTDLIFKTNGGTTDTTERIRITSAGNVGIGSDNPQNALDVSGDVKLVDNSPRVEFHDANADNNISATGGIEIFDKTGSRGAYMGAVEGANELTFGISPTAGATPVEILRIDADGKVGINTNDPQGTLQINDGLNGLEFNVNSNNAVVAYNRTTSSYLPVGLQGSSVQLRIGGTGTILDANASGTITTGINTSGGFRATGNNTPLDGQGLEIFCPNDSSSQIQSFDRANNETDKLIIRGNPIELKDSSNTVRLEVNSSGVVNTGVTTISGTSHLRIPVGTTNQRYGSPVDGDIRYNTTLNSYEGYGNGAWGGLGGGTEIDQAVSSTSATNITTFAHASYRSASMRIQITQGSSYQVGRYLLIHDGTTVTIVEESAIATGDMLGSISGAINGSNVEVKVTMNSASSATVTTIIDKITI